ncbi:type II toxin-antitoxin system VapC family toxin [Vulcanisaeta sp. JCM 14467]|uniref:type II toxin-antitoxin system VapC family toxin n=1 Tax=Vulcanisaeta sp. JCM 14467 TaxID=1295370 RepID=UPI002092376A|nr:type II toxin-antitoxin system VapC family toxin [Vulcanisaeta sp. JCM 14467]
MRRIFIIIDKAFLDANVVIYLNVGEEKVIRFFKDLLMKKVKLYTNVLVLDEGIYISKKKYGIKYEDTINFLDSIILTYVNVLNIGPNEYRIAKRYMNILKPSDALHVATMLSNHITTIISEDRDFDKIDSIKRVWVQD